MQTLSYILNGNMQVYFSKDEKMSSVFLSITMCFFRNYYHPVTVVFTFSLFWFRRMRTTVHVCINVAMLMNII